MLKILCQFAYERKSVHAKFFFSELAFALAKFSHLHLKKKQRNLPYVFVFKKVEINNGPVKNTWDHLHAIQLL